MTQENAKQVGATLRDVLNEFKEVLSLISMGREFQSFGADTEKARSPEVVVWVRGTHRRFRVDEQRDLVGWYQGSYTFSQRNFQDFSRTFKDQIKKNQGPLKLKKKPDYQTKQISK